MSPRINLARPRCPEPRFGRINHALRMAERTGAAADRLLNGAEAWCVAGDLAHADNLARWSGVMAAACERWIELASREIKQLDRGIAA